METKRASLPESLSLLSLLQVLVLGVVLVRVGVAGAEEQDREDDGGSKHLEGDKTCLGTCLVTVLFK